jgi:DNA-binding MarR family transcriptional regulator
MVPLESDGKDGSVSGPDEVDAEIHAAMNGVRRIVRALRIWSRAAEKALGVSGAQLFVLQQLADAATRADAAPSIAQLADLTATDPSSVSVVVSRLVARGLAARRASKMDARRAEVLITPAGRELLRRAPSPVQERMLAGIGNLDPVRRRALIAGLEAIVEALGVGDEAASMFFEEEGEVSAAAAPFADRDDESASERGHNGARPHIPRPTTG